MLTAAFWILGVTAAVGLGLAACYLQERPIRGAARMASLAHGLAGAVGVALLLAVMWRTAADANGFGRLAAWMLGVTLLGGVLVLAAQLRRRKPPGLLVALHATLGVGGFVILAAYVSLSP